MYIRVYTHFPTDDAYVVSNFQGLQTGCCIRSNSLFTSEVLARLCTRETAFTTRGHLLLMQAKVLYSLAEVLIVRTFF